MEKKSFLKKLTGSREALLAVILILLFAVITVCLLYTSIIIVGVILETLKQIESQMLVRNYRGFLGD